MVGGGASTWLEGALRRGLTGGEGGALRRVLRGRFDVVEGGASTWLEGAIRRGWRERFDVF